MSAFCLLLLFFRGMKSISTSFFLLGTGSLIGICAFDLIPDVFELGGWKHLIVVGVIGGVYSLVHLIQVTDHHHEFGKSEQEINLFVGAMVLHCLASGMLLGFSDRLTSRFNYAVFAALVAHKAYEATIVSTLISENAVDKAKTSRRLILYILALPFGVSLAAIMNGLVTIDIVLLITDMALGTLLGCLIFDFILPGLFHLKKRKLLAGWVLIGFLISKLIFRFEHDFHP